MVMAVRPEFSPAIVWPFLLASLLPTDLAYSRSSRSSRSNNQSPRVLGEGRKRGGGGGGLVC